MAVKLYTQDPRIVKEVKDACAGHALVSIDGPKYQKLPRRADYIVTYGQLSSAVERMAAGRGAFVIVLPEGADYLSRKVDQGDHVIIGSDYLRNT